MAAMTANRVRLAGVLLLVLLCADYGVATRHRLSRGVGQVRVAGALSALVETLSRASGGAHSRDAVAEALLDGSLHTLEMMKSEDFYNTPLSAYPDVDKYLHANEAEASVYFRADEPSPAMLELSQARNESACSLSYDQSPRARMLAELGMPDNGMYRVGNLFLRRDHANARWNATATPADESSWAPLRDVEAKSDNDWNEATLSRIAHFNPKPILPAALQEAMGCPTNGVYAYDMNASHQPIYFRYRANIDMWEWSPDMQHWQPTATHIVEHGTFAGMKPPADTIALIDMVEAFTVAENPAPDAGFFATLNQVKKNLVELKDKMKDLKWNEVATNLGQLWAKVKAAPAATAVKLSLAIVFGFFNGFMMGQLTAFGDAASACPDLKANVGTAFQAIGDSIVDFWKNFGFTTILPGLKKIFDSFVDFAVALKNLIWGCSKLKVMIGILVLVIVIAVALNAALVASGWGAVAKVVMSFMALVTAIPFILKTITKFLSQMADVLKGSDEGLIGAAQSVAELVGVSFSVLLALKTLKSELPKAKTELANSKLGKLLGLSPTEVQKGVDAVPQVTQAADDAAQGKQVKPEQLADKADDANGAKPNEPAKPSQAAKPGQAPKPAKPGQAPKPAEPKPGQAAARSQQPTAKPEPTAKPDGQAPKVCLDPSCAVKPGETPAKPGDAPKPGQDQPTSKTGAQRAADLEKANAEKAARDAEIARQKKLNDIQQQQLEDMARKGLPAAAPEGLPPLTEWKYVSGEPVPPSEILPKLQIWKAIQRDGNGLTTLERPQKEWLSAVVRILHDDPTGKDLAPWEKVIAQAELERLGRYDPTRIQSTIATLEGRTRQMFSILDFQSRDYEYQSVTPKRLLDQVLKLNDQLKEVTGKLPSGWKPWGGITGYEDALKVQRDQLKLFEQIAEVSKSVEDARRSMNVDTILAARAARAAAEAAPAAPPPPPRPFSQPIRDEYGSWTKGATDITGGPSTGPAHEINPNAVRGTMGYRGGEFANSAYARANYGLGDKNLDALVRKQHEIDMMSSNRPWGVNSR